MATQSGDSSHGQPDGTARWAVAQGCCRRVGPACSTLRWGVSSAGKGAPSTELCQLRFHVRRAIPRPCAKRAPPFPPRLADRLVKCCDCVIRGSESAGRGPTRAQGANVRKEALAPWKCEILIRFSTPLGQLERPISEKGMGNG